MTNKPIKKSDIARLHIKMLVTFLSLPVVFCVTTISSVKLPKIANIMVGAYKLVKSITSHTEAFNHTSMVKINDITLMYQDGDKCLQLIFQISLVVQSII